MRTIHYHKDDRGVIYCHAEEEIPTTYWREFKGWMQENELPRYEVEGVEGRVYRPQDVAEFLMMKEIPCLELIEDEGHIIREIIRGSSKLEIID